MKPGSYDLSVYRTGFERNDAYTAYLKLGSPAQLTPGQVAELQALTRDEPELQTLQIDASGTAQLTLPLREYDILLVELQRRASEP